MLNRRIVAIGECMVEFSPTESGQFALGFAGDTFNSAWYVKRALGNEWGVQYFTSVGDDRMSAEMVRFMQDSGIDTSHVQIIPGLSCGLYVILLDRGERSFSYWRSASAARTLGDDPDRLEGALMGAQCVIFSGITLAILPENGRQTLLTCIARARQNGTVVVFDSNIRKRLWANEEECRSWISRAYEIATLALPSRSDEAELFGDKDIGQTADRIGAAGVQEFIVKDDGHAVLLQTAAGRETIELGRSATVIDTTGAGDSFNAGYVAARLRGLEPRDALVSAHQIASKVILGHGALVPI